MKIKPDIVSLLAPGFIYRGADDRYCTAYVYIYTVVLGARARVYVGVVILTRHLRITRDFSLYLRAPSPPTRTFFFSIGIYVFSGGGGGGGGGGEGEFRVSLMARAGREEYSSLVREDE